MEGNRDEDRSEQATPHKLREARQRGQVAKSADFNSMLVLFAGLASFHLSLEQGAKGMLTLSQSLLSQSHNIALRPETLVNLFAAIALQAGGFMLPMIVALMVTGIAANMVQTGPVWSFTPIKPDIARLNPVAGFKRLFSKRMLFEAAKTVLKALAAASVLYLTLGAAMGEILATVDMAPGGYVPELDRNAAYVGFSVLAVLGAIAVLDLGYSRWDFAKRMRMSRREVKEEVKRREGDPLIRMKIKQLRREALKRAASMRNVKDANVLITNPTHLAVALRYERNDMPAPKVTAKGAGILAAQMKRLAVRHGVPIAENRPLARSLFRQSQLDGWIPAELYPQVAKVLVWSELLRKRRDQ